MARIYKTQARCKKCGKGFVVEDNKYLSYVAKNYCNICMKQFDETKKD